MLKTKINKDQARQKLEELFNNPDGPEKFITTLLYIRTKQDGIKHFVLNNIQRQWLRYLVKKYWKKFITSSGKTRYRFEGIREVCLKARQFGLSTLICAIFFYDTIVNEGTSTAIYCQDEEASKKMLKKYKLFYEKIPEALKPVRTIDNVTTQGFGLISSDINSCTPGQSEKVASKKGRSETIRNLHASEFAEWADSETTMTGLQKTVPLSGNIIIESSAKKIADPFHTRYVKGKKLDGKHTDWTSNFFPWFMFEKNRITDPKLKEIWLKEPVTEAEKIVIDLYNLDEEQLAWRRKAIDEAGDIKKFLKEEPEDDISCFETKALLLFPEPVRKTTCESRPAIFGHIHSIGVDVGGGGTHSDDYSIVVTDSFTREQIYQENGIMPPALLPNRVFEIFLKYPGFVGIESNNDRGLTAIKAAYSIFIGYEKFLFRNNSKRGGWWTSQYNKLPVLLPMIEELVRVSKGYPGLKISSEQIIREMKWYQDLGDGKVGAPNRTSESHDNPDKRLTDDSIAGLIISYGMLEYCLQIMDIFFETFIEPYLDQNELSKELKIKFGV